MSTPRPGPTSPRRHAPPEIHAVARWTEAARVTAAFRQHPTLARQVWVLRDTPEPFVAGVVAWTTEVLEAGVTGAARRRGHVHDLDAVHELADQGRLRADTPGLERLAGVLAVAVAAMRQRGLGDYGHGPVVMATLLFVLDGPALGRTLRAAGAHVPDLVARTVAERTDLRDVLSRQDLAELLRSGDRDLRLAVLRALGRQGPEGPVEERESR